MSTKAPRQYFSDGSPKLDRHITIPIEAWRRIKEYQEGRDITFSEALVSIVLDKHWEYPARTVADILK